MKASRTAYKYMQKADLIRRLELTEAELRQYHTLVVLETRSIKPFASVTIDCGEYDLTAVNEYLTGAVYTPHAPDGGILKLEWWRADGDQIISDSLNLYAWREFAEQERQPLATRALVHQLCRQIFSKSHNQAA